MIKTILVAICFLSLQAGFAQFSVRIIVSDVATQKQDPIFVAGSFNSWDPKDENFKMKTLNGQRKILVLKDLKEGDYAFKFTRGSWDKVETTANGSDIPNHEFHLSTDTTLTFSIPGWHDDFPDKPKVHTASPQVFLMDSAFFIPQLNRYRKIWVYLPKGYFKDQKRSYPVLYMQDGQNLFDEALAPFGEWGIDECLDTLQQQIDFECIVVGIENSATHRLTEYNPFDNEQYGKGEGNEYVDFLVNTLKRRIDSTYRSLKAPSNTFIAGSSMGGLISLYALMKYPDIFGAAGIFSPSLWMAPAIYKTAAETRWKDLHRIFFYAGGKETATMVRDMKRMEGILSKDDPVDTREIIFPLGEHSEKYWRMQFPNFYRWLAKQVN